MREMDTATHSLIRMGKGGLVVYIPKRWILEHNLKAGDRVEITLSSSLLVIKPTSQISPIPLDKPNGKC